VTTTWTTPLAVVIAVGCASLASTLLPTPDLWMEMYQGESFQAVALELLVDPDFVAALRSELER
jgi:hypothetical protein